MDKTKALQKLLQGKATKKEIELLKQSLASGEISIGGDVKHSIVITGDGNNISLTPEALNLLKPETTSEEPAEGEPPYMGLRYFDTSNADLFYGREVLICELLARVQKESFLAIVGASGSGKSSVARAGLIPTWRKENAERSAIHVITPTAHPLESLAASLTRESESVTATSTLMDDLKNDSRSLRLYVKKTLGETKLLLLVDQFEETFTLCKDADERKAFIENLLSLADAEADGAARVVITLRADFYAHCAEYEGLRQVLEEHQKYIGAMTPDELRQAITAPAQSAGWDFQPGLVDLILQDVGTEPGALPLLSHALLETWKRRQGHTLTLKGYADVGGVKKAITQTAESTYNRLTPAEQTIARGIFLRLTELGEGVQDTRRRANLDELSQRTGTQDSVAKVLKTLADARLLTTEQDSAEVAHEALIREWGTLRKWLDEDRDSLRLHRHLTESAQEWEHSGRNELYLIHRGGRLDDALLLEDNSIYGFNAIEQVYLKECVTYQKREQNRREHLRRQSVVGFGIGFIAVLAVAILAGFQWYRAEQQAKVAMARQLAAQAESIYVSRDSTKQPVAILLATQSMKIFPSLESVQILQNIIPARLITRMTHESSVNSVAFSPNGEYVVSGGCDQVNNISCIKGSARVWNAITGREIVRMTYEGVVNSVAFSPNGKYVVSGGCDQVNNINCVKGSARVWDAMTGREIARMTYDDAPNFVAFSLDGKQVVSGGKKDRTVRIWNATTGREIARMTHKSFANSVAFSPDGKYVVSGSGDNIACVWDIATGKEISRMTHEDAVNSVAFSPNGKYVVSGSGDNTARVWDIATGKEISRMTHENAVNSVAFSPDGKYAVSGSADNTTRVWDIATGREISRVTYEDVVHFVAFSPDSRYVVSSGCEQMYDLHCIKGRARVWEITTANEILRISHDNWINSVAFSSSGKYAVSGSADGSAIVWLYSPADLIGVACASVTRNLTRVEWEHYIGDTLPYQNVCANLPSDFEYIKIIAKNTLLNSNDSNRVKTTLKKVKAELIRDGVAKDPTAESFRIVSQSTRNQILAETNSKDIEKAFDLFKQADQMQMQIFADDKDVWNKAVTNVIDQISTEDIERTLAVAEQAGEMQIFIEDVNTLNKLCWYGSLQKRAEQVLKYCELAVKGSPDNAGIHDSRGLARALTGDYQGSILDFQYFIDHYHCSVMLNSHCDDTAVVEPRKQWIEKLEKGINPFTPEVLESLKPE